MYIIFCGIRVGGYSRFAWILETFPLTYTIQHLTALSRRPVVSLFNPSYYSLYPCQTSIYSHYSNNFFLWLMLSGKISPPSVHGYDHRIYMRGHCESPHPSPVLAEIFNLQLNNGLSLLTYVLTLSATEVIIKDLILSRIKLESTYVICDVTTTTLGGRVFVWRIWIKFERLRQELVHMRMSKRSDNRPQRTLFEILHLDMAM